MPQSSTVWWPSTSRSPLQVSVRPKPLCTAKLFSMWSKKPMPVSILRSPPSRSRVSAMSVSLVLRLISAFRMSLVLRKAHRDRIGVRIQMLALSERDDILRVALKGVARVFDDTGFLQKRVRGQGREKPRRARGRQDVARPRHIIAERLGRIL